jgi:hypothetical protein
MVDVASQATMLIATNPSRSRRQKIGMLADVSWQLGSQPVCLIEYSSVFAYNVGIVTME